MARPKKRRNQRKEFKRTDRVNETLREIVATQLERLGDERLELVTVTSVVTAGDLAEATVYYSAMTMDEERSAEVPEALDEVRWRIQKVINSSMRTRKVPQIHFEKDDVLASALRIEEILAEEKARTDSGDE